MFLNMNCGHCFVVILSQACALLQQVLSALPLEIRSVVTYDSSSSSVLQVQLLSLLSCNGHLKTLHRILQILHGPSDAGAYVASFSASKKYVTSLRAAQCSVDHAKDCRNNICSLNECSRSKHDIIRIQWPQIVDDALKEKLQKLFRKQLSSSVLFNVFWDRQKALGV